MTIKQLIGLFKRNKLRYAMNVDGDFEGHIHVYRIEILKPHYTSPTYYVLYSRSSTLEFLKKFNRFHNGTLGNFNTLEEAVEKINSKLGRGYLSVLKNYPYLMWKMTPYYKRRILSKTTRIKEYITYRARRIIG